MTQIRECSTVTCLKPPFIPFQGGAMGLGCTAQVRHSPEVDELVPAETEPPLRLPARAGYLDGTLKHVAK